MDPPSLAELLSAAVPHSHTRIHLVLPMEASPVAERSAAGPEVAVQVEEGGEHNLEGGIAVAVKVVGVTVVHIELERTVFGLVAVMWD